MRAYTDFGQPLDDPEDRLEDDADDFWDSLETMDDTDLNDEDIE
jgi:hypothetical protein